MRYYQNTPIKEWLAEDRPREKVIEKGIGSLTEAELIATLLATGTRELSALDLGRQLIDQFGGLRSLARCTVKDLMEVKGIGKAKAICLLAAFELARRKLGADQVREQMTSSNDIANLLRPKFIDLDHEQFHVLYLNRNNRVVGHKVVSTGGINATVIDPRIVFKEAIQNMATAIVFAHNHPSGNIAPSLADDIITEKLVHAAEYLDIKVMDHIILAEDAFFSYADNGDLVKMRNVGTAREGTVFKRRGSRDYFSQAYVQEPEDEHAA